MDAWGFDTFHDIPPNGPFSRSPERVVVTEAQTLQHPRVVNTAMHLEQHRNLPRAAHNTSSLKFVAPASAYSSPCDYNRNPYTEAEYAPKRFRPDKYEANFPSNLQGFTAMASSHVWMPPDYPNALQDGEHTPNSSTPFADEYTGITLPVGQLSNITSYGFPGGVFSSRSEAKVTSNSKAVRCASPSMMQPSSYRLKSSQPHPTMNTLAHKVLGLENFPISPQTSSVEAESNSGVPAAMPEKSSNGFTDLAKQAGIPEWNAEVTRGLVGNNSVFDGRWVLNTNEAWNVPARRTSVITVSPERQHSERTFNHEDDENPTTNSNLEVKGHDAQISEKMLKPCAHGAGPNNVEALVRELEHIKSNQARLQREDLQLDKDMEDEEELVASFKRSKETDDIPEAKEPLRLEQYVTDLSIANNGLQHKLVRFDPGNICKVFYQRVFNNADPRTPTGPESEKLVKYKGKVVAYGELHLYLLSEINDLVAFMTAPVGQDMLHRLVPKNGAVDVEYRRTKWLFGGDIARDLEREASKLTGPRGSGHHIGPRSEYHLFHQLGSPQLRGEADHSFGGQLPNLGNSTLSTHSHAQASASKPISRNAHQQTRATHQKSPEAQEYAKVDSALRYSAGLIGNFNTDSASSYEQIPSDAFDPPRSNLDTSNLTSTNNTQLRQQSRFGNPATADFNPLTVKYSPEYTKGQNMALSIQHTPTRKLSMALNTSETDQKAGSGGGVSFLDLGISVPLHASDSVTGSLTVDSVDHRFYREGNLRKGKSANLQCKNNAKLQQEVDVALQGMQSAAQVQLVDSCTQQLHCSSQGSNPEGLLLNTLVQPSNAHIPLHSDAQHQAQLQLQSRLREQHFVQAQAQPHVQFQGFQGHPQTLKTQTPDFNVHGHRSNGHVPAQAQGYPGQPPMFNISGKQVNAQIPVFNSFGNNVLAQPHGIQGQYRPSMTKILDLDTPGQQDLNARGRHLINPCQSFGPPLQPQLLIGGQTIKYLPGIGMVSYDELTGRYQVPPDPMGTSYVQPYVPADKFARAPAPTRLASRAYAQSNASLPISSALSSNNPSHFSPPVPNQRASPLTLPYRAGSDNMFPTQPPGQSSIRYQDLTRQTPTKFAIACDEHYIPFVEAAKLSKPAEWGVLKASNIPYDITPNKIFQFLGQHAKIITPDLGPSIHIMMDRSTGKTQDVFIEFFSQPDAAAWLNVIRFRNPQLNRLSDRVVEVELSSQEELMKELFPRARCVSWGGTNGRGVEVKETEEAFDSGFKGFISPEELRGLTRLAEQPHHAPYTAKCPPRPYQAMISILAKFPWYATRHYTLATRNMLYTSTLTLVKRLVAVLRRSDSFPNHNHNHNHNHHPSTTTASSSSFSSLSHPPNPFRPDFSNTDLAHHHQQQQQQQQQPTLTPSLLQDLLLASLNAFGYSDRQRHSLLHAAAPVLGLAWLPLSPLTAHWPFEALGRKSDIEEDVVEFYTSLLATSPLLASFHSTTAAAVANPNDTRVPFYSSSSFFFYFFNNSPQGGQGVHAVESVSMAEVGQWEMGVLRAVIGAGCGQV